MQMNKDVYINKEKVTSVAKQNGRLGQHIITYTYFSYLLYS